MKIIINDRTVFIFPSGLIVNRFTTGIIRKKLRKEGVSLTGKEALLFFKEIKRYKKAHGNWNLIEAESKDGNTVKIKI